MTLAAPPPHAPSPASAATMDNPFHVLELDPGCTRAEVERAGQKLAAMLEVGLSGADRYSTPLGDRPRDATRVRDAVAELRDPQRRLYHELWTLPTDDSASVHGEADRGSPGLESDEADNQRRGFHAALRAMGWRR